MVSMLKTSIKRSTDQQQQQEAGDRRAVCRRRFAIAVGMALMAMALGLTLVFSNALLKQLPQFNNINSNDNDEELVEFSTDPVEQSCTELTKSTDAFLQDVYEDGENTGLKPWKRDHWEIPVLGGSLLMTAFGGRNVFLIGDPTVAYTMEYMDRLMDQASPELLTSLPNETLTDGYKKVTALPGNFYGQTYEKFNNSKILWKGYRGGSMHGNCKFDSMVFSAIRGDKPDIILVNWGLHILYQGRETKVCNIFEWIHYEHWLNRALEAAEEAGTKVLLFKTTNRLCKPPPPELQYDNCVNYVASLEETEADPEHMRNVTDAEKETYCQEAIQTEEAVTDLNNRLKEFVTKVQNERPTKVRVALYNDHEMENCDYADSSGILYSALQLPRIRLFAHMVNCLYPRN